MTKKDYELIAACVRMAKRARDYERLDIMLRYFKTYAEKDNPRFNAEKFDKACEV